uniref:Ankyrin repeat protein n=1 Tax=viral metagenome TaxID=1070528 RepID=A0A6C0E8E4_9ZZZZ
MNSDRCFMVLTKAELERQNKSLMSQSEISSSLKMLENPFKISYGHTTGGFPYSTWNYIHCLYGDDNVCGMTKIFNVIREIEVPPNAKTFENLTYYGSTSYTWSSDKIILGEVYPLHDINTIQTLQFKITEKYFAQLCILGKVDVLEWIVQSKIPFDYNENDCLYKAVTYKNVNVLKWWVTSGLSLAASNDSRIEHTNTFQRLAIEGNITGLNLWKDSGLPIVYNYTLIDDVSLNGKIDVMNWFIENGLEFKYSSNALDYASTYGCEHIVKWWFTIGVTRGLELKYSTHALDGASSYGHDKVLKLWFDSKLPLKYTPETMDEASSNNKVSILELWKNSGLPLKYTKKALNDASCYGHINVLKWWKNSGLPLIYCEKVFRDTVGCSYYYSIYVHAIGKRVAVGMPDDVRKWWRESGLL